MTGLILAQRRGYRTSSFIAVPVSRFRHLVERFFASLDRKAPSESDENWVASQLSTKELALWSAMGRSDQAHSIAVAKMVDKQMPEDRTAVVAALLHDVGKISVPSGVSLRVVAALTQPLVSTNRLNRWISTGGRLSRLAALIRYPAAGSALLAEAGSDEFVVTWAAQHHLRPEEWTVDPVRAVVLRRADNVAVQRRPHGSN